MNTTLHRQMIQGIRDLAPTSGERVKPYQELATLYDAAPDLLRECEDMVRGIGELLDGSWEPDDSAWEDMAEYIQRTINKAKGK